MCEKIVDPVVNYRVNIYHDLLTIYAMKEKAAKKLDLPPPPEKPLPAECCERGCEKCVYVYYEEAYERWQNEVARIMKENDIEFHPSGREE